MPFDGVSGDPILKTLIGAKEIIKTRGWTKGSSGTPGHSRCVIGAIAEAAEAETGLPDPMAFLAANKIKWDAGYWYGTSNDVICVPIWADAPERRLDEVLAGFDRAV